MPGPTPNRRLINFRGTNDYALVSNKSKPGQNNGVRWSSCNMQTGGSGGGGGGGGSGNGLGQGIQYAYFPMQAVGNAQGQAAAVLGANLGLAGAPAIAFGMTMQGTVITSGVLAGTSLAGVSAATLATGGTALAVGALLLAGGIAWTAFNPNTTVNMIRFSKPCTPSNEDAVVTGFEEPDFNTFQQQYAAYLAGRSTDQQNVKPLEMQ